MVGFGPLREKGSFFRNTCQTAEPQTVSWQVTFIPASRERVNEFDELVFKD